MYVVVQHRFTNTPLAFSRGEKLIKNEGAPAGARSAVLPGARRFRRHVPVGGHLGGGYPAVRGHHARRRQREHLLRGGRGAGIRAATVGDPPVRRRRLVAAAVDPSSGTTHAWEEASGHIVVGLVQAVRRQRG
jgi:hypothetical protein